MSAFLEGHTQSVDTVGLTPDGRIAVSGSRDRTVRVWNVFSGQCLHTLKEHKGAVNCISLTPDGKTAVSGSDDKTLRVWDIETGRCQHTLTGHEESIASVSVTPDGMTAVSGSRDGVLRTWDLATARCQHTLDERKGQDSRYLRAGFYVIKSISVTPDGTTAVSGGGNGILCVWDLAMGKCRRTLEGHTATISSVRVTPDGTAAVSGSSDQTVRVWDLATGKCQRTLTGDLAGSGDPSSVLISLTPDGTTVVLGHDKTVNVCDLVTEQSLAVFHAPSFVQSLSEVRADGQFAFGTHNGQVVFVSLHGLEFGLPIATAARLWSSGASRRGNRSGNNLAAFFSAVGSRLSSIISTKGRWDDDLTALCEHCGERFVPTPGVLEAISSITAHFKPRQSPCLELPAEAWYEPRLLSQCPHCSKPLKFNPFIIDNHSSQ